MGSSVVTMKNSKMFQIYFLLAFIGFLMSFIPEESWTLFFISQALALLALIMFLFFWIKTKHVSKRYFSLLSFVMMLEIGTFFSMPLLRILFGTVFFWIALVLLITTFIVSFIFSESIILVFIAPRKSKISLLVYSLCGLVISYGSFVFSINLYSSDPSFLTSFSFLFAGSTLLFMLSPMLLIRPERAEELKKGN